MTSSAQPLQESRRVQRHLLRQLRWLRRAAILLLMIGVALALRLSV